MRISDIVLMTQAEWKEYFNNSMKQLKGFDEQLSKIEQIHTKEVVNKIISDAQKIAIEKGITYEDAIYIVNEKYKVGYEIPYL